MPEITHIVDCAVMALFLAMGSGLLLKLGHKGGFRFLGRALLVGSAGEMLGLSVIYRKSMGKVCSYKSHSPSPSPVSERPSPALGNQAGDIKRKGEHEEGDLLSFVEDKKQRTPQEIFQEYKKAKKELKDKISEKKLGLDPYTMDYFNSEKDGNLETEIKALKAKIASLCQEARALADNRYAASMSEED